MNSLIYISSLNSKNFQFFSSFSSNQKNDAINFNLLEKLAGNFPELVFPITRSRVKRLFSRVAPRISYCGAKEMSEVNEKVSIAWNPIICYPRLGSPHGYTRSF